MRGPLPLICRERPAFVIGRVIFFGSGSVEAHRGAARLARVVWAHTAELAWLGLSGPVEAYRGAKLARRRSDRASRPRATTHRATFVRARTTRPCFIAAFFLFGAARERRNWIGRHTGATGPRSSRCFRGALQLRGVPQRRRSCAAAGSVVCRQPSRSGGLSQVLAQGLLLTAGLHCFGFMRP